jgi:hypothetical protein
MIAPDKRVYFKQDDTELFKNLLPIKTMVGAGLVLGAAPGIPFGWISWIPFLIGATMVVVGTLARVLLTALTGKSSDPLTRLVVRGRKTAVIEGDFVVFHIGARPNKQLDQFYKWMGEATDAMLKEQEENPDIGCLGTEMYFGRKGGILIQYWRSTDHLNKFARSRTNSHAGPWAKLMAKARENADYGFWHEAFEVKAGKYDTVYINCPPMLLGNCRSVNLVQAEGKMQSGAGRLGKTDGSDYPSEIGKPDY